MVIEQFWGGKTEAMTQDLWCEKVENYNGKVDVQKVKVAFESVWENVNHIAKQICPNSAIYLSLYRQKSLLES